MKKVNLEIESRTILVESRTILVIVFNNVIYRFMKSINLGSEPQTIEVFCTFMNHSFTVHVLLNL